MPPPITRVSTRSVIARSCLGGAPRWPPHPPLSGPPGAAGAPLDITPAAGGPRDGPHTPHSRGPPGNPGRPSVTRPPPGAPRWPPPPTLDAAAAPLDQDEVRHGLTASGAGRARRARRPRAG